MAEARQRPHVEVDLLQLAVQRQVRELAGRPEAGVVDQQVDIARSDALLDRCDAIASPEVSADHLRPRAGGLGARGDFAQHVLAPRDQHHVVALARQLLREPAADAR